MNLYRRATVDPFDQREIKVWTCTESGRAGRINAYVAVAASAALNAPARAAHISACALNCVATGKTEHCGRGSGIEYVMRSEARSIVHTEIS